jgi:hypothetical protein
MKATAAQINATRPISSETMFSIADFLAAKAVMRQF